MKNDVLFLLNTMKRLLEEKGWTQGVAARNTKGKKCYTDDPDVACFCFIGAYNRARYAYLRREHRILKQEFSDTFINVFKSAREAIEWNDDPKRTKDEVLDILNKTIKYWEAK